MVVPDKSISERENSTGYTNGLPSIISAGANPVARVGSHRNICRAFWSTTPSHSWKVFSSPQNNIIFLNFFPNKKDEKLITIIPF